MPASDYILHLRERVGHRTIQMPGASAIILRERDGQTQVLLQLRRDNQRWSLIGGGADPAETPVQTLRREVREEAAIEIAPLRLVGVYGGRDHIVTYANGDRVSYTITAFTCRITAGNPRVNDSESLAFRFFPVTDLPPTLNQRHRLRLQYALTRTTPYFSVPDHIPTAPAVSYMRGMRTLIGHERLLMCGSSAVIRNPQGAILVQHRRDNGLWNLIGGLQEIGEDPAGTILREIVEETGLHVTIERLLGVYGGDAYCMTYPNGDQASYVNVAFVCTSTDTHLQADAESLALRWVDPTALPEPFDDKHRQLIDHAFQRTTPYFAP
jgi:8-oxo-dGTP diphosphatase